MQLKRKMDYLPGTFVPQSLDSEKRTVDVVWSKGSRVRRWAEGIGPYWEEISIEPEHLRLGRFKSGAPLLNTHRSGTLSDQIGVVERAWIEKNAGYATIKLSERADVEPIFKDICAGIVRNISFGYKSYKAVKIENEDDLPTLRSIDTEPYEMSLVPVGADPGAQVRSEQDFYTQEIMTQGAQMTETAQRADEESSGTQKTTISKKVDGKNTPPEAKKDLSEARSIARA